ncbi:MAG: serine/threonine protein kinase [Pseudomonadales bacterium]|nr:serine/threonine protein kinase [Pseudomonadales bacterium]
MDSEQLADLLEQASAIGDLQARRVFVEHATAGDDALCEELESLLNAHDAAGDFLEIPALAEAGALLPGMLGSGLIGSTIGHWHVDALIHTGGMGSVFRATRIGENFIQSGALKVINVGLETHELISRFTRERQLLARVEHPHIARLLDGGTTAEGLPWLAMEFIEGLTIDSYAYHRRLTLAQRLDLFEQLANAIAYLHENLITHRDIKASNVMVDGTGHVRVLDFGIADLLGSAGNRCEATIDRRFSLATAAPEQLTGGAISTATDVYALGVLLYSLLSGVPPYHIRSDMSAAEIEKTICEEVPPRASLALERSATREDHAEACQSAPARLVRELRGDLEMILAKALHKDPARRYRSVAELREDIERFRNNLPILARPDSAAYRSRKFLRRHWRGMAATASVMLSLAVGLTIALWQAEEARRQRDQAQAMNQFMQEVLAEADPYEAGADKRVRDVLAQASELLGARFSGQPLLEASLRQSVGGVQVSLLQLEAGEENLLRALQLLEGIAAQDDELRLRTEAHIAWLEYEREHEAESVRRYQSIIARLSGRHDPEFRATVHNDLGVVLADAGNFEDSVVHQERAMVLSPDAPDRVATLINLGYAYHGLGDLEAARGYYLEAIERLRARGEAGVIADLGHALNNYGNLLSEEGRDEEALAYYLESLAVRYRVSGPGSDSVALQALNVGRLLLDMQRQEEALPYLQEAVEIFPKFRDEDSIYNRVARISHARALLLTHDEAEVRAAATETLEQVLAAFREDEAYRSSRFYEQAAGWLAAARGDSSYTEPGEQ